MSSESRTLLVTGGSRGIGAAVAERAAADGYDVCLSYRVGAGAAEAVCERVRAAGRRAVAVRADVGSEQDVLDLWRTAVDEFGSVDVLVNNAGILETQMRVVAMEAGRLERILRVNVLGTMLCAREAVRHMSTARGGAGGAIVNVSSMAAKLGSPGEYVDYAASKAAVDTFTIGLAKEVAGEGIRVNGVRPGSIHTEIHASGGEPNRVERIAKIVPMRRGGEAVEIAEAILWLASDKSSYTAGAILDVAGGL